ncbi:MAG: NAD(P)-dependent oxidoreductase [Ardenticatenales bacterium]
MDTAPTHSNPRPDLSHLRIGFIGTGVMGAAMAGHLLDAGARLTVHTRTVARAEPLLARGARWAPTPAAAATDAEVVISIVGMPDDVEAVYFGASRPDGDALGEAAVGVLAAAAPGTLLIDMTTSRPSLAVAIHAAAAARGIAALDAPVSGGDVGARNATLSIMVGGDVEAFDRARPTLATLGRLIVHQGPAGAGQRTKLCNQIAIAGTMLGVLEALAFAEHSGLDPTTVLESIGAGAAGSWTMTNLYPRVIAGDFAPGFTARHFLKDLRLALEEARTMPVELPGLALAERLYARMVEAEGRGELGTHGLYLTMGERRATG